MDLEFNFCKSKTSNHSERLSIKNDEKLFLVPELSGVERKWLYCKECKLYYSTPRLNGLQIDKMYEIYRSTDFRKETEDEYFDRITTLSQVESENHYRVEYIKQHLNKQPSSCLDIGCGGGVLIHSLSEEFKSSDFYGVEPTLNFCELTNRRTKAFAINGYYTKNSYPGKKFDLITCCQVLEHVQDLEGFVSDLKTNMSTSSVFFLEVPSVEDFDNLEAKHSRFSEPSHLWYFTESFLCNLFGDKGLKVISSKTQKTIRGRYNLSMLFKL